MEYESPVMEPIGGSGEVVPMVTLAGAIYGVVIAVGGGGVALVVYGVVVTPCKPYWE